MLGHIHSQPPKSSRSETPLELEEIGRLKTQEPLTHQERVLLADDLADSLDAWQSKSEDDKEFASSVEADLGKLAVASLESPKDEIYGDLDKSIKAIWQSPSAFDSDRKPPRPEF